MLTQKNKKIKKKKKKKKKEKRVALIFERITNSLFIGI